MAVAEEPCFEGGGIGATETGSPVKFAGDSLDVLIGEEHWDEFRHGVIGGHVVGLDLGGLRVLGSEDVDNLVAGFGVSVGGAEDKGVVALGDAADSPAGFALEDEAVVALVALFDCEGTATLEEEGFHVLLGFLD